MREIIYKIIALSLLSILCACSQKPAHIVAKHSRNTSSINTNNPFKISTKSGDTLYNISKEHGVPIRELIELNSLKPPYILQPSQIIRLPQATFHKVKDGDTVFAISRSYGVDLGRLVHFNNIKKPYIISAGSKLRIPSAATHINIASNESTEKQAKVKISDAGHLRKVIAKDLGLLENKSDSPTYVLPKPVKTDPNAPKPSFRASSYPTPNLKPGTKYAKKFETASYNYNAPIERAKGFSWPVRGRVISRFGAKKGGLYNDGINISLPEGSPITAADTGKVVYSGNELRGYGNLVLIKHSNGYLTAYAHAKDTDVKKGDRVVRGQKIGRVGKTGHVSSPQLHFSIRKGRKALDPKRHLPGNWG